MTSSYRGTWCLFSGCLSA